jgi:YVTN family beta-propeller protein
MVIALALAGVAMLASVQTASARRAVVVNRESGTVTLFDTGTGALINPTIETGGGANAEPFGVAITPNGSTAYVTNSEGTVGKSVSIINMLAGATGGQIAPFDPGTVGVGITPDGRRAYIASREAATVSAVDTGTNTLIGSPIEVGTELESLDRGVAITPDGQHVYVARFGDDLVSMIDTETNLVIGAPIPAGEGPRAMAITPDGRRLYVTDNISGAVTVIDTATNTVIGAPIPVGLEPRGIAITPDGSRAYVANQGSETVSVIDTATNTVIGAPIPVMDPLGVAITPDGSRVLVGSGLAAPNNLITPISTATNAAGQSFHSGGDAPAEIAVVPNQPPKAAFGATHKSKKPTVESFDGSGSSDPDGTVARFEWSFGDGQSLAGGGPAATHTYRPGKYTATLTVTDNEGCSTKFIYTGQTAYCTGSAVATVAHTVGIPPQTRISKHPKKKTESEKAKFRFSADEAGAKFQCKLDRKKFKQCGRSFRAKLKPGKHKLQVKAIGKGGADPTPAKFEWTVLP